MSAWDTISDEEMRDEVLRELAVRKAMYTRQAERNDAVAAAPGVTGRTSEDIDACARYSRRQAAHYQQAIDLLTKAEMPEKE